MQFKNKIAVVTGGGAGIGRAIAERFAAERAIVVVADLDLSSARQTEAAIKSKGGTAHSLEIDVASESSVALAYEAVESRFGQLDIQISNAGITDRMPFLSMPLDKFERVLRVNLIGTLLCGQAAARIMSRHGGGRIVNLTSVSGQFGGTGRAAYGASKAAISNLTQTMAMELALHDILVNAIAPGPTQVKRTAHGPAQRQAFLRGMALQRYATPEEVAGAALFLCSGDASFITGHVLNVDGGFASSGIFYDPSDEQETPAE